MGEEGVGEEGVGEEGAGGEGLETMHVEYTRFLPGCATLYKTTPTLTN